MGNTQNIGVCGCCGGVGGCIDWCNMVKCGICKDIPTEVDITLAGFGPEHDQYSYHQGQHVGPYGGAAGTSNGAFPPDNKGNCPPCGGCSAGNGTYTLIHHPDMPYISGAPAFSTYLDPDNYDCLGDVGTGCEKGTGNTDLCGDFVLSGTSHYSSKNVGHYVYQNLDGIIECNMGDGCGESVVTGSRCGGGILTTMLLTLHCVVRIDNNSQGYPVDGKAHKVGHRWSLHIFGVADDFMPCVRANFIEPVGPYQCSDLFSGVGSSWSGKNVSTIMAQQLCGRRPACYSHGTGDYCCYAQTALGLDSGLAWGIHSSHAEEIAGVTSVKRAFSRGGGMVGFTWHYAHILEDVDPLPCSESSQLQASKHNWSASDISAPVPGITACSNGIPPCNFGDVRITSLETSNSDRREECAGDNSACYCDSECNCYDGWGNGYKNICCNCDPDCQPMPLV
jgi:hypothetical protein